MVAVPADMPVTTPDVPTVPIAGLLLAHMPPVGAPVRVVLLPAHTDRVPEIVCPKDIPAPSSNTSVNSICLNNFIFLHFSVHQ